MEKLNKAIELREQGWLNVANQMLLELVTEYPEHAQVNYQCAWSFDVLGLEHDAIPYYEKAIALGLPQEELKEAYLGLGSTYRAVGDYEASRNTLEAAIAQFNDNSLKAFLAMTYYNLGMHQEAMRLMLKLIAETSADPDVKKYQKALQFYADHLDSI